MEDAALDPARRLATADGLRLGTEGDRRRYALATALSAVPVGLYGVFGPAVDSGIGRVAALVAFFVATLAPQVWAKRASSSRPLGTSQAVGVGLVMSVLVLIGVNIILNVQDGEPSLGLRLLGALAVASPFFVVAGWLGRRP